MTRQSSPRNTVLVVGAGITGLTLALALRRADLPVQVYEQAEALREVGAGITVGPNAGRVLAALGLEEALDAIALVPRHSGLRSSGGQLLQRTERGRERYVAEFGAPFRLVHRADLLDLLHQALAEQDSERNPVRCGHRLERIDQDGREVCASFGDDH